MLILGFMFLASSFGNPRLLGYAANAMAFTVGWHYVKQGYGVIAVLSAIRRIYYRRSRNDCCCSTVTLCGSTRGCS